MNLILLVDKDEFSAAVFKDLLRQIGYKGFLKVCVSRKEAAIFLNNVFIEDTTLNQQ